MKSPTSCGPWLVEHTHSGVLEVLYVPPGPKYVPPGKQPLPDTSWVRANAGVDWRKPVGTEEVQATLRALP